MDSAEIGVAVDTETNWTKSSVRRFCLGVSITVDGRESFYMPIGHQAWINTPQNCEVVPELFKGVNPNVPFIFHNAKFDLGVLRKAGFDFRLDNVRCTLLMNHMKDAEQDLDLDSLALKFLGKRKMVELKGAIKGRDDEQWHKVPEEIMAPYAVQDSQLTFDLWQYTEADFEYYEELYQEQYRFMLRLLRTEETGLILDRPKAQDLLDRATSEKLRIQRELGFDPAKTTQLHRVLFEEQGLRPLSFTPKTKKPQVNDDFLAANKDNPVVALVNDYRAVGKVTSTYFGPYLELSDQAGLLQPTFNPTGTVTARLSGSNPNMQQIPREDDDGNSEWHREIKHCFKPQASRQLWELDYRNMEYRLAAVYADDAKLLELFRTEGDFHQLTADLVGIPRYLAKVCNFLILYGGGATALSEQTGRPIPLCKGIIESWRHAYPLVAKMMDDAQNFADYKGYIEYWNGWRRQFNEKGSTRKAFNSVIQGGCMQIFKRSMLLLDDAGFTDHVNYVHDSVWINVKDEDEAKECQQIMEEWTTEVFGLRFSTDRKLLAA